MDSSKKYVRFLIPLQMAILQKECGTPRVCLHLIVCFCSDLLFDVLIKLAIEVTLEKSIDIYF